jgi:hypothetical protein
LLRSDLRRGGMWLQQWLRGGTVVRLQHRLRLQQWLRRRSGLRMCGSLRQ